jgi:hypothetical protein
MRGEKSGSVWRWYRSPESPLSALASYRVTPSSLCRVNLLAMQVVTVHIPYPSSTAHDRPIHAYPHERTKRSTATLTPEFRVPYPDQVRTAVKRAIRIVIRPFRAQRFHLHIEANSTLRTFGSAPRQVIEWRFIRNGNSWLTLPTTRPYQTRPYPRCGVADAHLLPHRLCHNRGK